MARRRKGRVRTIATAEEMMWLGQKSSDELVAMRADIGSMVHVHSATVNKLHLQAGAITAILHARERPDFEVSDHAIVRYLEKVKGFDVSGLRREIVERCIKAKDNGLGDICRAKGDAVAYADHGLGFVVARHNVIVTVYPISPEG